MQKNDRYAIGRCCGRVGGQITPCADAWVTKRLRYKFWKNNSSPYPRFRGLVNNKNFPAARFLRSETHASGDQTSDRNVGSGAEKDERRPHRAVNAQTVKNDRFRRWARSVVRHAWCAFTRHASIRCYTSASARTRPTDEVSQSVADGLRLDDIPARTTDEQR